MAISGAAMAVFALGMFALRLPDVARYACSIVFCGAGGVVASAAFAAAPAFAPSPAQLGVVNGMLVQASNLAQFIGPTAAAASVAAMGRWEGALGLFIGANALLILLALLLLRQEKTAAARESVRAG
jgi:nitrate/nitrite transporter NarK